MTETIALERDGDVLVVRLDQPQRRNPLDMAMTIELWEAFENVGDAGAVALVAAGDHFCVGGDVKGMAASDDPKGFIKELADGFHRIIRAMRVAPPIVVGVRGWAAGAGMSTLLASDVVIAGQSVQMRPAYSGIGVTPDGGMSWTLPRAVGERRAKSILLRNAVLSADDALRLGIVDEVLPDDEVDARAIALAKELAAGPRTAFAGAKKLVHDTWRPLDDHLEAEAASISACADGPDGREGIQAFAERRAPDFTRVR
ncbi:enoyl-CoA hydratase/isomerase family protein [Jatrophihabitans fulvus]